MGLKWWLTFIAGLLVKLIIVVGFFFGVIQLVAAYPNVALVLCALTAADAYLFFRAEDEERKKRPRFFEWFPFGDGFYMWWKARKRGQTKWTI